MRILLSVLLVIGLYTNSSAEIIPAAAKTESSAQDKQPQKTQAATDVVTQVKPQAEPQLNVVDKSKENKIQLSLTGT